MKCQSSCEESFDVHLQFMESFLRLGENMWWQLLITVVEVINHGPCKCHTKCNLSSFSNPKATFSRLQLYCYYQVKLTQLDAAVCISCAAWIHLKLKQMRRIRQNPTVTTIRNLSITNFCVWSETDSEGRLKCTG